jgi:hypothetical protein
MARYIFLLAGFVFLAAGCIFLAAGCSADSHYRELDRAEAMSRLRGTIANLDPSADLLKHGVNPTSGSEYWIFATSLGLELPESVQAEGPSPCPADSVFGFAVSLGVDSKRIEPPKTSSPTGSNQYDPVVVNDSGRLWQWRAEKFSVRFRAVRMKSGYLNIVERLVEP